ncbi:MAG: site-specific integrase [Alphaproteobacteria bacterium]|nr:site-specific integrase [Alphaproteobacteria bacterium]
MRVLREGPVRITKATIEAAWRRRAPGPRIMIGDAECRGLALVVHPTGMTWRFDFKPRGTDPSTGRRFATQSVTIGSPGSHTVDAARAAAGGIKGQTKAGADPSAERKARIADGARRRAQTLDRVLDAYVKLVPSRAKLRGSGAISTKHASEECAHVRAAVAAMRAGGKPVTEVGAADLRTLLRADPEHPNAARHRFGAISRFFDWCQDEGLVTLNPCTMIAKARRPRPPASRSHYLKPSELGRLWKLVGEAAALDAVHRDLIRFLIAVPCRRGEATRMEWQHLDLDSATWSQPGRLTKNRDAHRIHLHAQALDILRARHMAAGAPTAGLVFPSPRAGNAVDGFSRIKATLARAAPDLTGWRLHDLRRSFATAMGEAGFAEPVVDAVLNHRQAATRGGVLGVYQRAQRWPEQVAAMERWGEVLAAAIAGRPASAANVVPLRSGGVA